MVFLDLDLDSALVPASHRPPANTHAPCPANTHAPSPYALPHRLVDVVFLDLALDSALRTAIEANMQEVGAGGGPGQVGRQDGAWDDALTKPCLAGPC